MGIQFYILALVIFSVLGLVSSDIEPFYVEPLDLVDKKILLTNDLSVNHSAANATVLQGAGKDGATIDILSLFNNANNLSFTTGFIASLSVIIVSELGDKTFFISAIMAMNNSRLIVFAGAMSALALMHVISAFAGYLIAAIPRLYTFYASVVLFLIFGVKMLVEAYNMKPEEVVVELEEVQVQLNIENGDNVDDVEPQSQHSSLPNNKCNNKCCRRKIQKFVPVVFIQAFTMSFLAEWGDRSQIATIALAATENIYGILVGGLLGHFLCTALAILGGKIIASKISVRTMTIVGGLVFLLFAVFSLVMGP